MGSAMLASTLKSPSASPTRTTSHSAFSTHTLHTQPRDPYKAAMFDVSWTDPTRETVAQRRNRKEQEQKTVSPGSSQKAPKSDDSSSGFRRPFPLTLMSSHRKDFSRPTSRAQNALPKPEQGIEHSRNVSSYGCRPQTSEHELPGVPLGAKSLAQSSDESSSNPYLEPSFVSWASQSVRTDSTWSYSGDSVAHSHLVQPLSPTSFVSQSTQITVTSHDDFKDDPKHVTVVEIYSDGSLPPPSPLNFPYQSPLSPSFKRSSPEVYIPKKNSSKSLRDEAVIESLAQFTISHGSPSDTWKAPQTWNIPADERTITRLPPPPKTAERVKQRPSALEQGLPQSALTLLQKNIRRMIAASPKIVLERLTEEWSETMTDASLFSELEFEKQLWMLAALQPPDKKMLSRMVLDDQKVDRSKSGGRKILSLYEDHASASYLSALNSSTEVYHLSTQPLDSVDYPNVHSFPVPSPTSKLPFASGIFSSIQSFPLPALFPSSSMPTILKECHRTLISTRSDTPKSSKNGSLQLTILDPSPSPATTGPRLRTWLDKHLIVNLERHFRCINPCRLFPIWLADAGLGGAGSVVTSVRFAAATETAIVSSYNQGGGSEEDTREELRGVVGRRLWEETWGGFIEGRGRWWDDLEITEECVRMGTTWEYLIIEAVKESP